MAIAKLISHDTYQAKKYIAKAHSEFNTTKYLAGIFFTMIAEVYLEYSETNDVSSETIFSVKKQLKKIDNIYEYLLLPIYIIKGNDKMIDLFRSQYEWFDFDRTRNNIKNFLTFL